MTLDQIQETPDLLKRDEAAELLRVSTRTFDRYVIERPIPKVTLSPRTVRFRRADIEALLTRNGDVA